MRTPLWRRSLRFWRADVRADVDDELRFHFEARVADLTATGLTEADALRVAHAEFGDVDATRRNLHAIGERLERRRERLRLLHRVVADVRFVLRGLRASPLFAVGVVLTLALALGAAASMYGVLRALLLAPPPGVAAPDEVARLYFHYAVPGDTARTADRLSYPFYEQLHERARTVAVAAYLPGDAVVIGSGDDARAARATLISDGYWRVVGARPALGRLFADGEAHPATGERVAVLGDAFWRRRFGGDPAAIGRTLLVKGVPYRVVGVAPPGFRGVELNDTDVWLPLRALGDGRGVTDPPRWHTFAGSANLRFAARRRAGVTPARAAAELSREHALFVARDDAPGAGRPETAGRRTGVTLASLTGAWGPDGRRLPAATVTTWLAGVAGVLLAVACANVASLLLLRALRRRREIAVRLALGMSRGRLAALLFTESATLALLGGAGAAVVVAVGGAWPRRLLLPDMLGDAPLVDGPTLAVSALALALTAVVTGLAPVLQARAQAPAGAGLADGPQHGATGRTPAHAVLLVAQTALSAVLLVGAGLFLRSLDRATSLDIGLDAAHAFVVRADLAAAGRTDAERAAFHERALERVRALPGVRAASLATGAPLRSAMGLGFTTRPGGDVLAKPDGAVPMGAWVTDGYFESVGMRLVAGRGFTPAERAAAASGAPTAVVINEALARLGWPGRSPIGECAYFDDGCTRVVGVAQNALTFRLREAQYLAAYLPLAAIDAHDRVLLVREDPAATNMATTLARVVRELDPSAPYVAVERLGDYYAPQLRPWRLGAAVFTAFGLLAALLVAVGLYTAMAYAVAQRTREFGVRAALGAGAARILGGVLRDAAAVAGAGVAAGLALALGGGAGLRDVLFETSPREPAVFAAVGLALVAVALAACAGPARRAARVDPAVALRAE